jgi:transposase
MAAPERKWGSNQDRRILVVGAHAVLRHARQHPEKYPWLTQLLARRPFKVVAVALANKMARIANPESISMSIPVRHWGDIAE